MQKPLLIVQFIHHHSYLFCIIVGSLVGTASRINISVRYWAAIGGGALALICFLGACGRFVFPHYADAGSEYEYQQTMTGMISWALLGISTVTATVLAESQEWAIGKCTLQRTSLWAWRKAA